MKRLCPYVIILSCSHYSLAQQIDSLLERYQELGKKNLFVNKDSASKYLTLYTDYAKEVGAHEEIIEGYKLLGIFKYIQTDYDSSLYFYHLSKQFAEETGDLQSIADVQSNIGLLENSRGNFQKAIEILTEACFIYDSLGIQSSKGRALINVAMSYESLNLLTQTEKVLNEAISIFRKTGDERDLAKCYVNLGLVKKEANELDSALVLYKEALTIMETANDSWGLSALYNNLGSIHWLLGDVEAAVEAYQQSIELKKQLGDKAGLFTTEKNLANIYRESGNPNKAKLELDKSYQEVIALGDAEVTKGYYIEYALVFESLKDYQQSVDFYKKYLVINDSLISSENARVVSEIENRYQAEKKDQEIELLAKTNEARLSQRNASLTLAFGLLLVGTVTFILFKVSQRKNKQLAEKNRIIEESLAEREVLLREIHHRVKNNLQIVSSLLNIQSKLLDDPTAKSAVQAGRDRVQSMALTHKLLYQNQNLSNLSLKDYISQLTDSLVDTYGANNGVALAQEIDEILIDVDTAVNLGLLINELISNAMKHAFSDFQNAEILIQLKQREQHLELVVADNGKGMTEAQEERSSYGMRLVRSLSQALRGQLSINSDGGTKVKLTMPI